MIFRTEDIGAFQITMKDIDLMQCSKPFRHLNEGLPNLSLGKMRMVAQM